MSVIGAIYTATARYGVLHGLTPWDIAAVRFSVSALALLPALVPAGLLFSLRSAGGLGWPRALILTACAGPLFSLLLFAGLQFAPLAHGGVVTPATIAMVGFLFAMLLFGERPDRRRWAGLAFVVTGIGTLGWEGLVHEAGPNLLLGDLMFISAGIAWAGFGVLLRQWRADPIRTSAMVALISALTYLPFYFALADSSAWAAQGAGHIALQVFIQGILAGALNLYLFTKTVELLGPAPAALFGAMVPACSVLTAIPVLGEWPTALQWTGLLVITVGLLLSFVRTSRLRR